MDDAILINGRFLTQPLSGVQRYAREIVRALDRLPDAERRYRLMVPSGADPMPLDRIPVRRLSGSGGHLWEQVRLADAARNHRLLSLCGAGPVGHARQAVVIHDAAVFRRPDLFRSRYALAHRVLGRRLAKRARLATVSRFSQAELAAVLNLAPDAIAVAPNSADHLRDIIPDRDILRTLDVSDRRYFVCIGNQTPNKNLAVAVRALARLPDPDLRLVLVGARLSGVTRASPRPRRSAHHPGRSAHGPGDRRPVERRDRPDLPQPLRGFRHSAAGGHGPRLPRDRLRHSRNERGLRRRRPLFRSDRRRRPWPIGCRRC